MTEDRDCKLANGEESPTATSGPSRGFISSSPSLPGSDELSLVVISIRIGTRKKQAVFEIQLYAMIALAGDLRLLYSSFAKDPEFDRIETTEIWQEVIQESNEDLLLGSAERT